MIDLSIIIVNWNTRQMLADCLESVYATANNLDYETWVVDNASRDGSTRMVRDRFPWVHLIENQENLGFARANNQAIEVSRGRYVVLLNSDTEVFPGALEMLVRFMDAHPQVGGCGPLLLNADGSLQESCYPMMTPRRVFWRLSFLDQLWPRATYDQRRWDRQTPRQVEAIKGACLVLRRTALVQVGDLDESYFMYSEEFDLCYRLAQADWQLWWVPQAVVTHYGGASSEQMAEEMYVQLYRSKVQFQRKFGGSHRARCLKCLLFVAYVPRLAIAALGRFFSHSLAVKARTYRRFLGELAKM